MATTKPRNRLTLRDRLSRLTFAQACKLLGGNGRQLIQQGGRWDIDIDRQVRFERSRFRVELDGAAVTVWLADAARDRLRWSCDICDVPCAHAGAVFALVLEEKMALGLAAPPRERAPVESLSEQELVALALSERETRAKEEKFRLRSSDPRRPWTDYTLTSAASGKTYRVALRGEERGESYCSCPDFRTNTLGTCKHVMYALQRVRARFSARQRGRAFVQKDVTVYLTYGERQALRVGLPARLDNGAAKLMDGLAGKDVEDIHDLLKRIGRLEALGQAVTVYPDAEEYIQQRLFQDHMASLVQEIRRDPAGHPLRKELLKTELLPFQLDGIAFAAGTGRAVLADDMGLGKTIQGIGVAELLAREAGIGKVLVICPTSLKSQWRSEVARFSGRSVQLVLGAAADRARQYDNDAFFTICNYEQVLRDVMAIERVKWDLIVLDEGQRIKNWEAKTTNVVKSLRSPFALVLSGTPLENRLDDLYSVVQFVDDRRLGPAFRFFNRHRVVDEKGKLLGYRNLDTLRRTLKPMLLRRTRDEVLNQLPERTTEIVRIAPTDEQCELHRTHMQVVASIVNKPYITEMDLLRLRQALLMCRMAADSTYLCTKQEPGYSSKLERLADLTGQLFEEAGRKVVLFSEWTTMLSLIEEVLQRQKVSYVRLDGSVPQKRRQQIVNAFQDDPDCRMFITTNAGSTGLNLQAANTVINVDLPWNPAVLEQRIARAHRMGQKRPVQVYLLVTEQTLEEQLLTTLSAKMNLALAALDMDSDVNEVSLESGAAELRGRLEVLLGAKPEAAVDETLKASAEEDRERLAHRERVAAAGGELLGAVFKFLGEVVAQDDAAPEPQSPAVASVRERLADCVQEDEQGRQRLSITLPDRRALDGLAKTLARLLATRPG